MGGVPTMNYNVFPMTGDVLRYVLLSFGVINPSDRYCKCSQAVTP